MKTIELSELVASTILDFCENLAELGCPRQDEPDMWFRNLPSKKQVEVAQKLIDIVERDMKRFEEEDAISCKGAAEAIAKGFEMEGRKAKKKGKK